MKTYAQSKEDLIALEYFGTHTGTVLEVGANDGMSLSNSLLLIEMGWTAVLIEPSPKALEKLIELHKERIAAGRVEIHPVALAHLSGEMEFNESGEHLGSGDVALLSSLSLDETHRWKDTTTFTKIPVKVMTWSELQQVTSRTVFDLVSIDAEGMDFWILEQMDLDAMKTSMVIVEFNGANERAFTDYCAQFGMRLIHKNAENLILAR